MKEYPTTIYTPKFNNGVFEGATRWEHAFIFGHPEVEDLYESQDYNWKHMSYDDLCNIIGNSGEWCVISLIGCNWDEYYEVVPHETDCIAGCEIMTSGNFSDCWKYAEGYNTID